MLATNLPGAKLIESQDFEAFKSKFGDKQKEKAG